MQIPIMERVAIFIDGANLYNDLKALLGRADIDYDLFDGKLCGDHRRLVRAYYYNATINQSIDPKGYKEQQRFFDRLNHTPYLETRLRKLVYRGNVPRQKGVDVWLAVDMLNFAVKNTYDTAILVSGDGDFAAAIRAVKDLGKHVENAYFKRSRAYELLQVCDRAILIDAKWLEGSFVQRLM